MHKRCHHELGRLGGSVEETERDSGQDSKEEKGGGRRGVPTSTSLIM